MSLLGDLAGEAAGALLGGGQSGGQQNQMMQALLGAIAHYPGGLAGLIGQFEKSGLGEHVASWIGNSRNLPISAEQIREVLGSPLVAELAGKLGIDPGQAAGLAAQVLPNLVDKLTPAGAVTEEHGSSTGLMSLAGQLFKG